MDATETTTEQSERPETPAGLISLDELAKRAEMELPAVRYYIYNKETLKPDRKIGNYLYFSEATAAAFVESRKKDMSINDVSIYLASQYKVKTQKEWLNWLRGRIYTSKRLPKPGEDKFWLRLKLQVAHELKRYPTQQPTE